MSRAKKLSIHSAKAIGFFVPLSNDSGRPPCNSLRSRSAIPKGSSHSSQSTGYGCTSRFRPVSESRNFPVAASVDEPVARIRSPGYSSAAILSRRLGSAIRCTSSIRFFLPRSCSGRLRPRHTSCFTPGRERVDRGRAAHSGPRFRHAKTPRQGGPGPSNFIALTRQAASNCATAWLQPRRHKS